MTAALSAFDQYAQAVAARAGNLDHLRTRTQLEAHEKWQECPDERVFLVDCSRRWGKTWEAAFKVFETIATVPRRYKRPDGTPRPAIVRYCAPTKLAGRQFVIPVFEDVARLMPPDMRPKFDGKDVCWRWPNGGVCYLGSAESMADAEAQVGTSCDLAICDEAGKYPLGILSHLIKSVYGWQFATTPNGRIFIPSTPPLTPAHDLKALRDRCYESGAYARYTIDECDHITEEDRLKIIRDIYEQEGGETAVQREAYCEYVTDETMAIIPEMRAAMARPGDASIVVEWPRPTHFDCYVSGDFGFSDLTAIGFWYLDWERACLVQEDEIIFRGAGAMTVGLAIMRKRRELWGDKEPRAQVADAPQQLLATMAEATARDENGVPCRPCIFGEVVKTDADAALNGLRTRVINGSIRFHKRCRVTIDHMSNGTWNTSRTSFARSDTVLGHFDCIEQAKYVIRHVDWRRCPTPPAYGLDPGTTWIPGDMLRAARAREQRQLVKRHRR